MKAICHFTVKQQLPWLAASLALMLLGACISDHPQESVPPTIEPALPTLTVTPPATPTSLPTSTPADVPTVAAAASKMLSIVNRGQPTPDNLAARSAVLIDAQSGGVLSEKRAVQKMYPASTTKIMTALLALEYFKPDEWITVGDETNLAWTGSRLDAQKAGLEYGQELTMKELLYGLLLPSGSDAAFVIAVNVARRESGDDFMPIDQAVEHFSYLMNARARELGAVDTNFINPDGYHDPHHYSTAYDLALIARQAMQESQFRKIVSTSLYKALKVTDAGGNAGKYWANTNRLIDRQDDLYYAPANGIKTGTTPEAGYCLISSAVFRQKLAIAVVLDSTQDGVWSDSVTLLDYAKDNLP